MTGSRFLNIFLDSPFIRVILYKRNLNSLKVEVGTLINNAGVAYSHAEYYHLLDEKLLDTLLNVNCTALMIITSVVIKPMTERKRGEYIVFIFFFEY